MNVKRKARSKERIAADYAGILAVANGRLRFTEIADRVGRTYFDVRTDVYAMRRKGIDVPVRVAPRSTRIGAAVYRQYDAAGRLLYIGASTNPVARQKIHASASHWFRQVVRVDLQWFDEGDAAFHAERIAIRAERPLHNNASHRAREAAE